MKQLQLAVKRYISQKAKYWLMLPVFVTILLPHTALAAYEGNVMVDGVSVPIVALSQWPDYTEKYDVIEPVATKKVVATAYNSEVGQTDDSPFTTAFGTQVRDGIIATNDLPRGTRVRFPEVYGTKVFTVEDRMNRRYTGTGRIDIWMADKSTAIKFGARRLTMEVLPNTVTIADNR